MSSSNTASQFNKRLVHNVDGKIFCLDDGQDGPDRKKCSLCSPVGECVCLTRERGHICWGFRTGQSHHLSGERKKERKRGRKCERECSISQKYSSEQVNTAY